MRLAISSGRTHAGSVQSRSHGAILRSVVRCVSFFFFSSRRRHTRFKCDWSSDVCSSDLQGIEQAYQNLVHMLAEFLPRLVVMLVIVAVGFLVALALKYILRGLLHLTKLDRLSEEAGASNVLRMAALPSIMELLGRSGLWGTGSGLVLIGVSLLGVVGWHVRHLARRFLERLLGQKEKEKHEEPQRL